MYTAVALTNGGGKGGLSPPPNFGKWSIAPLIHEGEHSDIMLLQ